MKKLFLFFIAALAINSAMAQCSPAFTYSADPAGSRLLQMQFTNTTGFAATGLEKVYYSYNFGDGSSGTDWGGTTNHTYASTGTYTVTLTMVVVYDSTAYGSGDSVKVIDTICGNNFFQSVSVAYPECGTVILSSIASSSSTSEVIDFSTSTPSGATMTSYLWSFGDGSTSTLATPVHTYTASADYSVTLTASDGSCTYNNSTDLPVSGIYSCAGDTAGIGVLYTYGLSINFYCSNTPPAFGQHNTYSWSYGDGSSSTVYFGSGAYHTYAAAGTYTVSVTVDWDSTSTPLDSLGDSSGTVECSATASYVITVAPINRISGYIEFYGPAYDTTSSGIKVWLITYDSSTSLLTAVDSTTSYGYYEFLGEPNGEYRVKAYDTTKTSGMGYVPTYADSTMHWDTARVIYHSGGDDFANIYMRYGTLTSGPGFIGGSVLAGADIHPGGGERTTTSYTPVAGALVFLYNASGVTIAYTYTDGSGNYSFSNLPLGSYFTYPEALNYKTIPYAGVTLTSSSASATGIGFIQHTVSKTITPTGGTASVTNIAATETKVNVYPNPTSGTVNIAWQQSTEEKAQIVVSDITGREVYKTDINITPGMGSMHINLSELINGLYIVRVKAADINYEQKIVLQR